MISYNIMTTEIYQDNNSTTEMTSCPNDLSDARKTTHYQQFVYKREIAYVACIFKTTSEDQNFW